MTVEVKEKQAKQGDKSQRTAKILVASLVAAGVVWALSEVYFAFVIEPVPSNSIVGQNEEPAAIN